MKTFLVVGLAILSLVSCSKKEASNTSASYSVGIMGGVDLKETDVLATSVVGVWDEKNEFSCTGTLIADNIVLTAAHCIESKSTRIKIVFGVDFFSTLNARELDIRQDFLRSATAVRVHEKYQRDPEKQPALDQDDIALIKFSGTLPVGFKPVPLVKDGKDLARGVEATIVGYGVNKVDATEIDPMTYNEKKLIEGVQSGAISCDEDLTDCYEIEMKGDGILRSAKAKIHGFSASEVRLDETHGQGTCSGDSGGPAFIMKDGAYFLFGVTSRGNILCNKVGIYTNVVEHAEWLEKNIPSL